MKNGLRCSAVVLAAGKGSRMGTELPKQFLMIGDKPVIWYSLDRFQNSALIDEIILTTGKEWITYCKDEIVGRYGLSKVRCIVEGGENRYDSVYNGLLACSDPDFVMIHDGARPFIMEDILARGLEGAQKTGACVVGMPSKDTVKISDAEGFVRETPDRNTVWIIQTPQIFRYTLIREAFEKLKNGTGLAGITDDAMVVERAMETKVALVEGSYENMKITTPEDLLIAERILKKRES